MNAVQSNDVVRSNVSYADDNTTENKCQGYIRKKPKNPSKNIALLLYPDCDGHAQALAKVISKWDYTYILHDKDKSDFDDVDMHGGASDGDVLTEEDSVRLIKPHYHVLIHLPMKKEASQVAKELKLEQRFVQRISDRTAMLCYLIHTGIYDKFQYKSEEVHSNRPSLFREALKSVNTNTEKLEKMITIIQNKNCKTVSFGMMCMGREGLTDFALKNFGLFKSLIEENNYPVNPYPQITSISGIDKNSTFENLLSDEELPF